MESRFPVSSSARRAISLITSRLLDAEGNLVSWSGTRAEPVKVPIKQSLEGELSPLAGSTPSAKCADTGDCPPDFPGCHVKDAAQRRRRTLST